jgi:hypothetical protein
VLAGGHLSAPKPVAHYSLPAVVAVAVASHATASATAHALPLSPPGAAMEPEQIITPTRSALVLTVTRDGLPGLPALAHQDPYASPREFVRVWVGDRPCYNVTLAAGWNPSPSPHLTRLTCDAPAYHGVDGAHVRVLVTVGTPDEPRTILSPGYLEADAGGGGAVPLALLEQVSGFVTYEGPVVHRVSPRFGALEGGTPLTVTGGPFLPTSNTSSSSSSSSSSSPPQVHIYVGSEPCVAVQVVSDTELTCMAPAGIGSCVTVAATFEESLPPSLPAPTTSAALNDAALSKFSYHDGPPDGVFAGATVSLGSSGPGGGNGGVHASSSDTVDSVLAASQLLVAVDETNEAAVLLGRGAGRSSRYSLALACPSSSSGSSHASSSSSGGCHCVDASRMLADTVRALQCFDVAVGVITSPELQVRYRTMVGAEGWPVVVFQYNGAPAEYVGPLQAQALADWTVQMMNKVEAVVASVPVANNSTSGGGGGGGATHPGVTEELATLFLRQPQAHGARHPLYASSGCA